MHRLAQRRVHWDPAEIKRILAKHVRGACVAGREGSQGRSVQTRSVQRCVQFSPTRERWVVTDRLAWENTMTHGP